MLKALSIILAITSPVLAAYPEDSVCEIRVLMQGGYEQGSGTLIGVDGAKGLILTAGHVAIGEGQKSTLLWRMQGNQKSEGVTIAVTDTTNDLGLIICDRPNDIQPVPVSVFDDKCGPWLSLGYRDGKFWTATATGCNYSNDRMELNTPYVHGMSGGPTLDKNGHLVGVVSAINKADEDAATIGFSVDGPRLQSLLNQFRK